MPKTLAKIVKNYIIGLRQSEMDVIERIAEQGDSPPEIIRGLIRQYGTEHFQEEKGYSVAAKLRAQIAAEQHELKKKVETMSDEEYAEKVLRAKVLHGYAHLITPSSSLYRIPLGDVKKINPKDTLVTSHIAILEDKDFTNLFGMLMDADYRKDMRARWQQFLDTGE